MWYRLLIILFLSNCFVSCKTSKNAETFRSYETNLQIEKDLFDNIYILQGKQFTKLNSKQDTLFDYTFPMVDQISKIDLLNPNEIVVFSENAQLIVILDNTLSEITRISLLDTDIGYVKSLCRTRDDVINVLSRDQKKLYRMNDQGKILSQSELIWNFDFNRVTDLMKLDNLIGVNDSEKMRLLLYDEFGTFVSQILQVNTDYRVRSISDYLYFLNTENKIEFRSFKNPLEKNKVLEIDGISGQSDFLIIENDIYILNEDGLTKKKITQS